MSTKKAERIPKYERLTAQFITVSSSRPPYTTYRKGGTAATLYTLVTWFV